MGRDSNFTCKTCKTTCDLGYGPYSTWLDSVQSLAEYDALPGDFKDREKNKNVRASLKAHDGHDWVRWSGDWTSVRNGHLYIDGGWNGDTLYIEDIDQYTQVEPPEDMKTIL